MTQSTFRILLVDDDQEDCAILKAKFAEAQRASFIVEDVRTAIEGLAKLQESGFDAVLVDLNLENGSGLDFIAALSEHGHTLPAIMITGVVTPSQIAEAHDAGAVQILSKDKINSESIDIITTMAVQTANASTVPAKLLAISRMMVTKKDLKDFSLRFEQFAQATEAEPPDSNAALWEKVTYRIERKPVIWLIGAIMTAFFLLILIFLTLLHPEIVDLLGIHSLREGTLP